MKIPILILFTILLSFLSPCHATIYKWIDNEGKVHFDNNGANALRTNFKTNRIVQSIKWEATNVTISATSKAVNKQQVQYNKQREKQCLKTNKKITAVSERLSQPLKAQMFDALKVELRKLRWEKRKDC